MKLICPGDGVDEVCGGDLKETSFYGVFLCEQCGVLFQLERIEPGTKLTVTVTEESQDG